MPPEKIDGRRKNLKAVTPVATTNAGLWLDKFLNGAFDGGPVRDLIVQARENIKSPDGYLRAFAQREAAIESFDGGFTGGVTRCWSGAVDGRMIVGIGLSSVRETGISLLRTWGVPFIPGSALKGVAASMACRQGESWNPESPGWRALFGDQIAGGCVIFHDAWLVPPPNKDLLPLDLDVMTVHHVRYYGGADAAPCDWDEPNPVAFVTAHGEYRIAISGPLNWVDAAGALLTSGLANSGVGAKTAAGYGRLTLTRKPTRAEEEEERAKQLREEKAKAMGHPSNRFKDASNANDVVKDLLKAQREGTDPADVRAEALKLWLRAPKFWKEWLKKPSRSPEERELMGSHL